MKYKLSSQIITIAFILSIFFVQDTNAQTLHLIPNPDNGSVGGPVFLFNGKLYVSYSYGSYSGVKLAEFDGKNLRIIPNPDENLLPAHGYIGLPIIFNNKLYIRYADNTNNYHLAEFNGNSLTVISNPDSGFGYLGNPVILNNKIYFLYGNVGGTIQLAFFDGKSIFLISNPDPGGSMVTSLTYKGALYNLYDAGYEPYQVQEFLKFDGATFIAVTNQYPDLLFLWNYPVIFHDKMYLQALNIASYNLVQSDGNSLYIIPNPDAGLGYYGGGNFLFTNKLFITYSSASGQNQLAYLNDDSTLTIIPNPDDGNVGSVTFPAILDTITFNGDLYIQYESRLSNFLLAKYKNQTLSTIPNSKAIGYSRGYQGFPIVFNGNLFLQYRLDNGALIQEKYDGNSFTDMPNAQTYEGYPIIYNNQLFGQYTSFTGNHQLGYIDFGALPLNFLSFNGKLDNENIELNWQTAQEENTSHFIVQRSNDGITFDNIGNVIAAGNSGVTKNYEYVDNKVKQFNSPHLYYRLQEVDIDGKMQLSSIVVLKISPSSNITIYPNPANDVLNVDFSNPISQNTSMALYNANGEKIVARNNISNDKHQQIKLTGLTQGSYFIVITQNGRELFTKSFIIQH